MFIDNTISKVVIGLCSILCCVSVYAVDFAVDDIKPKPNYKNKNKSVEFLTDGNIAKKNMWINGGVVGWLQPPPINISLTVDSKAKDNLSKKLSIHTQAIPSRSIAYIQRIDVYGKDTNDQSYVHLNGVQYKDIDNENASWKEVNLPYITDELKLVIYPVGKIFVVDEIKIESTDNNALQLKPDPGQLVDPEMIGDDSFSRLLDQKAPGKQLQAKEISATNLSVYLDYFSASKIAKTDTKLKEEVTVQAGDISYIRIDYANSSKANTLCISDSAQPVEVYELQKIYSVTGKELKDPLMPISGCVTLDPFQDISFLVKAGHDSFYESKQLKALLRITDDEKLDLEFAFSAEDKPGESCDLIVNPWGYPTDLPIWQDQEKTVNFLKSTGVNVYWVAPASLPKLGQKMNAGKIISAKKKLLEALKYLDEGQEVVLVAAFNRKYKSGDALRKDKQQLSQWLGVVSDTLAEQGIPYSKWSINLIDEARDKKLSLMLDMAKVVDEIDDNIRIYANPILSKVVEKDYPTLLRLKNLVDIWQPRMSFVKKVPQWVYKADSAHLWIYDNPSYPPKEADLSFYRDLPVKVVELGATGVAFWSLSATNNSSAWIDTDGNRPDWSVLYESDKGPLSSLRWEAFQSGVSAACEQKNSKNI